MINEEALKAAAVELGFADVAVIDTAEIAFEPAFRICCEDNSCGKYGANYTCPPDCGSTDEMRERIRHYRRALVLESMWDVDDPMDIAQTAPAKSRHNQWTRTLRQRMDGPTLMAGASGCSLCNPCMLPGGEPCRFPEERWSCMSAYCIYVQKLTERCGMSYDCGPGCVSLFSLLCFD